ncbi:MAG TPA: hypothetical protein VMK12_27265 [Anaeromyxobacteraceae bacterium]|nr:hypothetical protein [Anaeromyxobacteraceae bacterium]
MPIQLSKGSTTPTVITQASDAVVDQSDAGDVMGIHTNRFRSNSRAKDIQDELSALLGRTVALHTPGSLSRHFRERVVREAQDQHVAA